METLRNDWQSVNLILKFKNTDESKFLLRKYMYWTFWHFSHVIRMYHFKEFLQKEIFIETKRICEILIILIISINPIY